MQHWAVVVCGFESDVWIERSLPCGVEVSQQEYRGLPTYFSVKLKPYLCVLDQIDEAKKNNEKEMKLIGKLADKFDGVCGWYPVMQGELDFERNNF